MQPLVHPWNPAGYLRNAVSGINFWVLDSQEYSGYEVYKNQCLICHSEGIISSQKFDKKGWLKLISKMKKFGADIAPDEEEGLTRFLMGLRKRKPIEEKKSSYSVQRDKFELVKTGAAVSPEPQQLYESTCAQCHGNDGEGKIGPRLKGRLVPKADFVAAVTRGKNRMPAFGDSLTQTQVLGLWQHLQKTQ
ncbi:MAG: hypothetical protein EB078_09475 [Proteobacteria bacterium]|nr:hypothetical protein [Pseudomonadota bacterium]NDD05126.1 hypothetical protein [Pseudomonadota bacterium]NDG26172.1 hypothetical protein [Pseudomonadota bacterium]